MPSSAGSTCRSTITVPARRRPRPPWHPRKPRIPPARRVAVSPQVTNVPAGFPPLRSARPKANTRIDQDLLRDWTESYLKSLIAEASGSVSSDFDSLAAFGELGINSFHVLKIIKKLENDFGTLPKSLLFENFNVNDLANYFVAKHEPVLTAKFADGLQRAEADAPAAGQQQAPAAIAEEAPAPEEAAMAPVAGAEPEGGGGTGTARP